jgi:hypothetical protein
MHDDEEVLALATPIFDRLYEFNKRTVMLGRARS